MTDLPAALHCYECEVTSLRSSLAQAEMEASKARTWAGVCEGMKNDAEAKLKVAQDDFIYLAEQCESTARVEGISIAEARTWKVVGRLAREASAKVKAALAPHPEAA